MEHAKKYSLPANTIEKDYVLNWLLAGIAVSQVLRDNWVFKGGTCLKKCYFEEYRFSEDLDYTLTTSSHLNENFLIMEFTNIAEWIYEQVGIEFSAESLRFEEYENPRGHLSVQGRIAYKGPMQRRGNNPAIKLDLSCDEIIVSEPIHRPIHHPYSDHDFDNFSVQTYCIEEIFAEKLRALIERMRPRDLYDVVHLHVDERWQPENELVLNILEKKCEFKDVDVPTMAIVDSLPRKQDLAADWNDMLAHQIANLGPYDHYWDQLTSVFAWLYRE